MPIQNKKPISLEVKVGLTLNKAVILSFSVVYLEVYVKNYQYSPFRDPGGPFFRQSPLQLCSSIHFGVHLGLHKVQEGPFVHNALHCKIEKVGWWPRYLN